MNERLSDEQLQELVELSAQGHKCPYSRCNWYESFNQCYNHSHVLCKEFPKHYQESKLDDL